jgi:hypothetical protein
MLRRIGIVCIALLMVVGTADVFAQGRPGGGRGGFRGFGGGFGGRGQTLVGVLRVPEVQDEIELTQSQKDELGDILAVPRFGQRGQGGPDGQQRGQRGQRGQDGQGQDGQAQGQRGQGFRNFQNRSEEERAQMREQFEQRQREAAEREKEQENKIAEVLEKPQMDRLLGIYIQTAGAASLENDRVADALELSGQQKEEIATAREESQEKLRTEMRDAFQPGGDREAIGAKMQELRAEADKQVLAHLTDAQREAFENMKGAEFDMPRRGFGGPGGGFRGGPGGPGGQPGANNGGNRRQRPQRPGSDNSV